jgi:hypothetical protein
MGIDGLKMPYKLLMAVTNLASCYWSLVKCARYFAPLHPKLTEGHKALGMALMLEEMAYSQGGMPNGLERCLTVKTFDVGAAVIVETALLSSCVRKDILLIDLLCGCKPRMFRQTAAKANGSLVPSSSTSQTYSIS